MLQNDLKTARFLILGILGIENQMLQNDLKTARFLGSNRNPYLSELNDLQNVHMRQTIVYE